MGLFSSLSRAYSKALKKFTLTGVVTLNRQIFIKIYAQIRPESLSERAIRAGWKRMGLFLLNKQRILDDEEVKNFGRTTPEYQPLAIPEGPLEAFTTPKHFKAIRALKTQLKLQSTPSTRRKIEKLGNATLQEHTASQLLALELKQVRDEAVHVERNRRSKRLQKEANQRSWNFDQIKAAREGVRKPIPRIEKKGRRKLIFVLPYLEPK
ncbi:hypothetical protein GJ744_001221 [Endocarpon pusillum]|uniref:Uncharacterized protein n=1 Tax=Endocarpon pusillum TaxID=364733 RepID=A0A8H7A9N3_9EURO|nr:hypothetical protein GJ744_001221 [Endocarpon pusillum]